MGFIKLSPCKYCGCYPRVLRSRSGTYIECSSHICKRDHGDNTTVTFGLFSKIRAIKEWNKVNRSKKK